MPKIRVFALTVVARIFQAHLNAFARKDFLAQPSVHSVSTWTSVARRACATMENASTWTARLNASAIRDTNSPQMERLALVKIKNLIAF